MQPNTDIARVLGGLVLARESVSRETLPLHDFCLGAGAPPGSRNLLGPYVFRWGTPPSDPM